MSRKVEDFFFKVHRKVHAYALDYYISGWYRHYYTEEELEYTDKLLALKKEKPEAIEFFYNILNRAIDVFFSNSYVLVPVPTSNPSKKGGVYFLVERLCQGKQHRINGCGCLYRTKAITPTHKSGQHNLTIHEETIRLDKIKRGELRFRNVILIDDIITSGCTMRVCRDLIKTARAKEVICLALGAT